MSQSNLKSCKPLVGTPQGYATYITNCKIKDDTTDLGVVVSEVPATAAALFTKNQLPGEPIKVGREHIKNKSLRAVVVNSKNANVATGKEGYDASMATCEKVAEQIGCSVQQVLPSSTGVIGRRLPVENILGALENLEGKLKSPGDFTEFATAIMTTDTFPKWASRKVGNGVIVGVAKGSGMIEPDMATMLSYFFTDLFVPAEKLDQILRRVAEKTFNSLSVDSDMSTSDTLAIMANGLAGEVDLDQFEQAVLEVAVELTRLLARDGEGATKLFVVDVVGAADDESAKKIAKSIINSPLIKTMIYQGDPNWGRIYMAVGKTPGLVLPGNRDQIGIFWGEGGKISKDAPLEQLTEYLQSNEELLLTVDMQMGQGSSRVYGCDYTEEYVKINAYYTT